MNLNHRLFVVILVTTSLALFIACDEKSTEPEHDENELVVTMEHTPDPATSNTEIMFIFEVEDHGEHVDVTEYSCEIELEGSGNHLPMTLTPEAGETGHYVGNFTFTEAGTYEIHFEFMHEEEINEEKFNVQVL